MIPLYVQNGISYVWNSEDWFHLRSEHRICGAMTGTIVSYPRQNNFLGLPMALMAEEAALLVEKGVCELYELPNISDIPSEDDKNEIMALEKRILEEQEDVFKKRKIEQMSQKIDIIVAGKRQKMLSKGITDVQLDKETLLQDEINKLPKISAADLLVHIPTEYFRKTDKVKAPLSILKPSVLDIEGAIRCSIYKDLWERGHHVTNGLKFGSDYLVYPGDPAKFHATYMVRCIYDNSTSFHPANITAFGRLSVAVNKLAVLAFCNSYGKVNYQTLQWHDSLNV